MIKNKMKKIEWFYNHLEEYIIVALLVVMVIVIFTQVVMRFLLNSSLVWSEELARVLFIWASWLGISYGQKKYEHIKITMVVDRVEGGMQKAILILADLCTIAILAVFAVKGVVVVEQIMNIGSHTPALGIPKSVVYASVPISCTLMGIRVVKDLAMRIFGGVQGTGEEVAQ